ncbi:MAG: site-2 protease family protein [Bacteroidota bacterium]
MRGSLKLFTWFGIPVHLHWSFGLILLYAIYAGLEQGGGLFGILLFLGIFMALFACVLLHEFGHSLTARRYGVETQDIILTPIGGIARLERMPEKPIQEFFVAIMGPMVNVAIAILLLGFGRLIYAGVEWAYFTATIFDYFTPIIHFFQTWGDFFSGNLGIDAFWKELMTSSAISKADEIASEEGLNPSVVLRFLPILLSINIVLVLFNMIPAFPMDGGRVFRALLAMRIGRVRATQWAARVGQLIAMIFVAFGLSSGAFTLILIGFFVFNMARTENNMVKLNDILRRFRASDLMRGQFTKLSLHDWMQTPIELINHGLERHFLVFDMDDKLAGALIEPRILEASKKRDTSGEVGYYMMPVEVVDSSESMAYIYQLIAQSGQLIVAVANNEGVQGVIDAEGLRNFMRVQQTENAGR